MKNGDTNNAMKACCAELMDYVRQAGKFSRLPVPIQVTTLLIETENVNDLFAGRIGFRVENRDGGCAVQGNLVNYGYARGCLPNV